VQADEQLAAREPANGSTARQRLQVEHQIELVLSQRTDALPDIAPVPGRGPTLPVKPDHAGKVWIAFEQRRVVSFSPPVNLRVRVVLLEQSQHGQRVDNVAERAGLEDQDLQRRAV
jgi:hypothetical protein